jgi:hypothetical protein
VAIEEGSLDCGMTNFAVAQKPRAETATGARKVCKQANREIGVRRNFGQSSTWWRENRWSSVRAWRVCRTKLSD